MADITITIPTAKVPLVKAAIGYKEQIVSDDEDGKPIMIDNPQSALEYAEEWLINQIKREVRTYEKKEAIRAAVYTNTDDIV